MPIRLAESLSVVLQLFLSESQWINKVIDCCARIANMEKAETWRHFLGIIGRKPFGEFEILPPCACNPI